MNSNHYCPHTPEEIQEMLAAIGVDSIDGLFAPIPAELRCTTFNLPQGMSEFETYSRMQKLAADNSQNLSLFIGGGFYDHIIPAAVDHLAGRAEFYTAYTPYQPECSQGTLQALFEYQTAICRITGMDVSNASLYDGATALAEAALMAMRSTNRNKVLVDSCVSPIARQVLATYLSHHDAEIIEIPHSSCSIDRAAVEKELDENTAALLIQYPNAFGTVDDFSGLSDKLHAAGALLVSSVYPLALGILKSPAEIGADIAVGDGQSLGNPLSFGGPSFGFIASTKAHIRNIPGRIVGETLDKNGKRGFVLTLQAREQHIKRHKATSNICSNQSLCALRGLIFLSSIGKQGLVDLSSLNYNKAEYAKAVLASVSGISLVNTSPTFNEFTVALTKPADNVVAALLDKGIAAGIPMGNLYKGAENLMVVTVTEKRTKREIDCLAKELEVILCN